MPIVRTARSRGVPVFFAPATFDVINVRAALVRDPEGDTIELNALALMGEYA